MGKVTVNMLGSCVIRDIFGLKENDAGYEIRQFLNFISPLTMFDKGIDVDKEKMFSLDVSKICLSWNVKCAYLDMTRGAFDYILARDADFLVIDAAVIRFDFVKFAGGGLCCRSNNKLFKVLEKKGICPKIEKIVSIYSLPKEELRRRVQLYAENLRRHWPLNKIILVEVDNVDLYYSRKDGYLYCFDKVKKHRAQNELLKFCFGILLEELKGCHVIRMPENVVADSGHTWRLGPMHYTMEYYDYGLRAMDCISAASPEDNVEVSLEKLRRECSNLYLEKYGDSVANVQRYEMDLANRGLVRYLGYAFCRVMTHVTRGKLKDTFRKKRQQWWRIPDRI